MPSSLPTMEGVPFKPRHLPALLLVGSHARPPQLAFLVGVLLVRAPLDESVQLGFYGLARRCRAAEIPAQGHPDWFVVYQHGLLLQTNVCTCPLCPVSAEDSSFPVWLVRTGANRDFRDFALTPRPDKSAGPRLCPAVMPLSWPGCRLWGRPSR